jgi:hypothetical protein
MKYLLTILFLGITIAANAQGNPGRNMSEPSFYTTGDSSTRMAGEYLQKYSRQYYLGTGLMVGGYIIALAAIPGENPGLIVAGGLATVGGFVVQLLSHRHIGRAGELLQQSAISQNIKIQGSSTGLGLGLAYHF